MLTARARAGQTGPVPRWRVVVVVVQFLQVLAALVLVRRGRSAVVARM